MKKYHPIFVVTLLLAFFASQSGLRAQSPAAETIQQKVNVNNEIAPPAEGTASDADLGDLDVVQRVPKPDMFTVSTSQQFFYTDNVFYTHHDELGAPAYLGSYTASFVPYSLRDWTPRVTLQYNMVRYDGLASGDFDNENAAFSSQYVFGEDRSWTWTASVNLSRFTSPHADDHEFYQEVVYDNQVSHVMQLKKDCPLFFIATYDLAYHQANPDQFDRLDNTLSFSVAYYIRPDLSVTTYVRPSGRYYPTDASSQTFRNFLGRTAQTERQEDRLDLNLTEGIDVTWTPIKYLSVSADFSHVNDYSNNSAESYDQSTPGVSLTGTYKF